MESVNMHEAKTHFSELVARVEKGEEVLIARAGHPVARIVPVTPDPPKPRLPRLGFLKGTGMVTCDIKEPFRKEIEKMFYGTE